MYFENTYSFVSSVLCDYNQSFSHLIFNSIFSKVSFGLLRSPSVSAYFRFILLSLFLYYFISYSIQTVCLVMFVFIYFVC
jgi:hypothetical protein